MTDLTPLGIAALALLVERPMHPYEMYQLLLQRRQDRNVKVRPGSLYHTVDRLAGAGFVEVVGVDRTGNRPERTNYRITAEGRAALAARITTMLATPAHEYPEFRLAIGEAHNLPADRVIDLLTTRRAALGAELDGLAAGVAAVEAKELPERFWLDVSYHRAILTADIAWLDATIARISDSRISWTSPVPEHLKESN